MSAQAAVIWEIAHLVLTGVQMGMKEDELVTRAKEKAGANPTPEAIKHALVAVMDEQRVRAVEVTKE